MSKTARLEQSHSTRVADFRRDLGKLEMQDVIRKHITTGEPFALSSDTYYRLRQSVAGAFSLHPSAVVVVGSFHMGFSLEPERR